METLGGEVLAAVPQAGAPEITVAVMARSRTRPTPPLTAPRPPSPPGSEEVLQGQQWDQLTPGVERAAGRDHVVAVSHHHHHHCQVERSEISFN